MNSLTISWFAGFMLLFLGERAFPGTAVHWPITGLGILLVLGSVGMRVQAMGGESDPGRADAQRRSLGFSALGAVALLMYFSTTTAFTDMLGFDEDAAARWYGSVTSLWAILWLLAALPLTFLDRALSSDPVLMPGNAPKQASISGLSTALAIALVFPVNYLANAHLPEIDVAYFRTTKAGSASLALVRNLPEPVKATLFFAPGNDVKEQVEPYFASLADASDGRFSYTVVDQAMEPELAEALKVRDNGYIALSAGELTEKFKVGDDIDKAKRDLKKLDATTQKHLLKLAKGQRNVYMLTGHGEASARESDNQMRKLNAFKRLLQDQNFKVNTFGVTDGSTDTIPEDAALLVLAAPTQSLLPEEETVIAAYLNRGGALLVLAEPLPPQVIAENGGTHPLDTVLAGLGVKTTPNYLAHATQFYKRRGGISDRVMIISNRFGSHPAVKEMSRRSAENAVLLPTVSGISEIEGGEAKVSALLRSFDGTWEETNGNMMRDATEKEAVFQLAVAVEGPEGKPYRAIVVGDVTAFSDPVIKFSRGNDQFAKDSVRWLVGDEDLAGDTESEEDVKIEHTRNDDTLWFMSTIFGMPLLVLLAGVFLVRKRRS